MASDDFEIGLNEKRSSSLLKFSFTFSIHLFIYLFFVLSFIFFSSRVLYDFVIFFSFIFGYGELNNGPCKAIAYS